MATLITIQKFNNTFSLFTEEKEKDRQKRLMLEGMEAISFGVRKRERLSNQWFRWKYREEIEVSQKILIEI